MSTPVWTYSDWITKRDQEERLTRLQLHINEVSQFILGQKTLNEAYFPVHQDYLDRLMKREAELLARVDGVGRSFASNVAKFNRS